MKWLLLTLALAQMGGVACSQAQQAQTKAQRQPLEKQQREYKSPTGYEWRDKGYNPKTKEPITYDHKPRIELVDAKSGKYAFKWIGYDGQEKSVIFQRADAVDVVVSGSVSRTPEGSYLYTYEVQNLPTSGAYLSGFAVQNYAPDTRPVEINSRPTNNQDLRLLDAFRNVPPDGNSRSRNLEDFHIGQMSSLIEQFKEGSWIRFAPLPTFNPQIIPGRNFEVKMLSSAPPGLVGCRVTGGELTMKGAGEHMPFALENLLPGYEEWPRGHTIGPVDSLKTLSSADKVKYVLEQLPQFRKLGWMTDEVLHRYEQQLKSGDLGAVSKRIEQDLRTEQITTEVFAIIQAMR